MAKITTKKTTRTDIERRVNLREVFAIGDDEQVSFEAKCGADGKQYVVAQLKILKNVVLPVPKGEYEYDWGVEGDEYYSFTNKL